MRNIHRQPVKKFNNKTACSSKAAKDLRFRREYRYLTQGGDYTLLPKEPFIRTVREVSQDYKTDLRWTSEALAAIMVAAEDELNRVFQESGILLTTWFKKETLNPPILQLAGRLAGHQGLNSFYMDTLKVSSPINEVLLKAKADARDRDDKQAEKEAAGVKPVPRKPADKKSVAARTEVAKAVMKGRGSGPTKVK